MKPTLDVMLCTLIGLALLVAAVLAGLDKPVPELVDYVAVACLAALGVRRIPERRPRS